MDDRLNAVAAWDEWRRMCALGRCRAETQRRLQAFAAARFHRMARACLAARAGSGALPLPRDVWHLFETHLVVRGSRRGKRYKEWLFARVAPDAPRRREAIEGGASLIMRDVVREYVRKELAPAGAVSLDEPLGGAAGDLTLRDMLPDAADPVGEAARREYETLSRAHAEDLFGAMPTRTRVAVLARSLGLSLEHAEVQKAAGCRKSMLHDRFSRFLAQAARRLRERYPADDRQSLLSLTLMTVEQVKELVLRWAESERVCLRLLAMSGRP
ncbi:MAG: hypothetical protein FJ225_09440 [Lentisphaerae bacterium]|nr:hypothetical protein [Lentisphaerota bacterium]